MSSLASVQSLRQVKLLLFQLQKQLPHLPVEQPYGKTHHKHSVDGAGHPHQNLLHLPDIQWKDRQSRSIPQDQ